MCWEERYTQRRTVSSSRIFRRALRARRRRVSFFTLICYALLLLSFFATYDFVGVTHTLAFVRLRTTEVADLRSHLTDQLLVDALDQDIGLAGGFSGNTLRQFVVDRMGEAQREVQDLAFGLGLVTHTDQLQLALEALAHANDHVVDQCTSGTGHGLVLLIAIAGSETQLTSFLDHFHGRVHVQFQGALGALDRELLASEFDLDACRQLDGVLSNARHAYPPLEHGAEHFTADTGSACSAISHHTFVGGDDGNAQTAANFRQLIDRLVLAQAGTADALDFLDDRTAFEVLQLDGQLRLGVAADLVSRD